MKPLALTWLFRFVLALFVGKGLSSHYRGGTVSYRPNGNSPYSVDFSFRLSFRRGAVFCDNSSVTNKRLATTSFSNSWRVTRYGWYGSYNSGSTAAKIYCSDFNVKEDWSEGYNNFTYSGGSGDAYWIVKITDGGDWIHNIIYSNPSDDMLLNAKVNRTDGVFNNSSPVSSIPLTVYVVKGIPSVVRIPVEDPDGDIVRCRNATYLECYRAMCTYFPYGVLDERNCTLSYNGNGSLGLYPIILKLEDFPHETTQFDSSNSLGSVDLQFIVHVKDNLTGLVRIQGGGSSGRLQVYYNGVWGTVCDDGWTMTNTHVVCRQLGFRGAISYHNNGGGSGQIWLDDVRCSGSESSIEQCRHNGWGRHNCGHSEDVFVTCSPKVQVRLVNGTTPNEGRVEVYYNGRWGTICDDDWGISDANVVCRQLGLPPASFAPCCAQFGQGTGPILMDDVGCNGGESSVTLCRFRGWGSHNCAHSEDAGVVCGNISRPTTASLVATTSPQGFNDSCQSFPCLNGGTCYYNWYSGHRCTCPYGYSGRQCEINMIPCNSNPCRNRGTCQSGYGWYRCTCPFGYTGRQCETRFNDSCPSFPCLNGGTCYYNGYYGYRCNCPYGYSGRQCETNMNPCNSNPCRNRGTCQSGYGWYRCTCPFGYTGRQCETRFNDSCPSFPCLNGGTCYYNWYSGYRCNCPSGYSGRQCETNMNQCVSRPCRNGGTCRNGYYGNGYYCSCLYGYTGRQCESNLRTRVTCGENYMQIELKSQYFSDIDWRNLHLRNTSCRATRTLYTMTLRTPLDGCGTTYTEQDKKLVLWNEVRNENLLSAVGNLSSITRGGNIILPFFCEYGREKLVSTSFSASKKRVFASEGSYGNFTFTMDLYQTSQYRTPYSPFAYPVVVYPNQPLWVQYQVKNTNADLVVFAKKCHATPSNDPNAFPQHVFLEKGCIRDPTMVYWYNPYSQVQRFSIRSFRFVYSNTFLVYLHCQLIVCHRNSTNSRCARGCISPRRRREAIDMDGSKEYDLSAGPLKGPYTKTGSDKQGGDESSLSTSATVGVVSAVAVVALLVATILAVKMLRNRSRLHDHVATPAPPIAMNVTVNSYEQQVMENDDRMEIEI